MKFKLGEKLLAVLHRPSVVFWFCSAFLCANVIFDGTLYQIWSLYQHKGTLATDINQVIAKNKTLALQIKEAQRPEFIEKQARDQLDLVAEGDLLFVFSDNP